MKRNLTVATADEAILRIIGPESTGDEFYFVFQVIHKLGKVGNIGR